MAKKQKHDNVVIIKKHIPHEEGVHGVWKLAYADLMTGMMAFFIFMWIINIVSSDQTSGLSDYFSPPVVARDVTGIGLSDAGLSPNDKEGSKKTTLSSISTESATPRFGEDYDGEREGQKRTSSTRTGTGRSHANKEPPDRKKLGDALQRLNQSFREEQQTFVTQNTLKIEEVEEGVKVQLLEGIYNRMFTRRNGSDFTPFLERVLEIVSDIIRDDEYNIAIEGHSQSFYSSRGSDFTQWELAQERAVKVYRYLLFSGISPDRIISIQSYGDQKLLFPDEPEAIQNNRISLTLFRNARQKREKEDALRAQELSNN